MLADAKSFGPLIYFVVGLVCDAHLRAQSDGPYPKRPPVERRWAKTWPHCSPNCSDAEMVVFWHGQATFAGHDGLCQETCRDLGHTQMGIATLGNVAETAHHQGWDLWGEIKASQPASLPALPSAPRAL